MSDSEEVKPKPESYPCFVQVTDDEQLDSVIELPTEKDGTIFLSTVQAQYPNAIGLKYKSESGVWRGIRISDSVFNPPFEGWGSVTYHITLPKTDSVKRKMEESPNREPEAKLVKTGSENDFLSDLIVLGLPYKATENDLKEYFQQYGELAMHEVKHDPVSKESRGFGFIRFKNAAAAQKALKTIHTILGRRCEVRLPKKKDEMPLKLFVGRLPEDTGVDELRQYFGEYGEMIDVYIPKPFRGFGFVTFAHGEVARQVLHNKTHMMQGNRLNVTYAEPKGDKSRSSRQSSRSQDRPFDFEDMRQVMNSNTRQVSSSFNPYTSSSKSPRHAHGGGVSADARSMFYPYLEQQQQHSAMGGAYSAQETHTVAYPDARSLQYGGYWSSSK